MNSPPLAPTPASDAVFGPALLQRYHTLCTALDVPPADDRDCCARFIDELKRRDLPRETVLYLLFQLFLARIPSPGEIAKLVRKLDRESAADTVRFFMERGEFVEGPQYRLHFELVPRSTLLIDVSHTLTFPHNSGIQRVVRCTTKELRAAGLDHALVRFDPDIRNYRLLEPAAAENLYAWKKPPENESPVMSASALSAAFQTRLQKIVGRRLTEATTSFLRTWREVGRDLQAESGRPATRRLRVAAPHEVTRVAFLWDNNLLLPEVMLEKDDLERLQSVLTQTPITSSLVVYDLIPLHHPEYCLVADGFVRYLTLLRTVDRITCISEATADDVRKLLRLTRREKAPPRVETHYLAGDFDREETPAAVESGADDLPVVLSVGSIEARKNHRRILRAMVLAQQQGCRFRGVFAGNPGWLNEDFLQELAAFQAAGYQVELRRSVSEAELRELYAQAAFTLYCSLVEGFGLPIVESVLKGVPCIASNRSSMRELVERLGGCVPVDPLSETEIAAAVVDLLTDRPRLERLRDEAKQTQWRSWRDYACAVYQFASEVEPAVRSRPAA